MLPLPCFFYELIVILQVLNAEAVAIASLVNKPCEVHRFSFKMLVTVENARDRQVLDLEMLYCLQQLGKAHE
jgi:hypothetical protein